MPIQTPITAATALMQKPSSAAAAPGWSAAALEANGSPASNVQRRRVAPAGCRGGAAGVALNHQQWSLEMSVEPGSREQLWETQFSAVDSEISKMASLCGIDLLDRAQLKRALENDASVCTHDNALAFEKLHTLLKAHYLLRSRAADRIGEAEAQQAIERAVTALMQKFAAVGKG
jgi:hypothetical protein